TNYTLLEMGKPTHAFDLDLLEGGKIIVRRARSGEMLKTLDGIERKLSSEDMVVADARKPVALAGVMGGFDTMITEKTRNVLSETEIQRILMRFGFGVNPGKDSDYLVQVPSWRLDVEREIDLIEELARLHGYDKFANTLPAYAGSVIELPDAKKDEKLRSSLLALGYNEAISVTFISHEDAKKFSRAQAIELANPLSEEASVMRTSMVPGMLNMLAYNLNRGVDNVRLFEAGKVFEAAGAKSKEWKRICLAATGSAVTPNVHQAPRPISFFDIMGDVENLLVVSQLNTLYYDAHTAQYYHPGRPERAVMDGATVAQFGQNHPDAAAGRKL